MKKNSSVLLLILGLIAIVSLGATGYFAKQYSDLKKNPNQAAQAETEALLKKVSAIYDLPKKTVTKDGKEVSEFEQPTVATVEDKEKLKDQPFFASAENGDKLLIFAESKKAIIYRQKDNRIINSGPIAITQGATVAATVRVINGGSSNNSAKTVSEKLAVNAATLGVSVTSTGDAKRRDYTKAQVIIIDETARSAAESLSKSLGADVVNLPDGEDKPVDAQILVIAVE
jgi:transcriptional regulator of heat shock response